MRTITKTVFLQKNKVQPGYFWKVTFVWQEIFVITELDQEIKH